MGLLDHRKVWDLEVDAPPARCLDEFAAAFGGKGGGAFMRSEWKVRRHGATKAEAVYGGRAGVAAAAAVMSRRSASEEAAARGSEVTIEVVPADGGGSLCRMYLSSRAVVWIWFTADARFIRSAMRSARLRLVALGPAAVD